MTPLEAPIPFNEAIQLVKNYKKWMEDVKTCITSSPGTGKPSDLVSTQHLAFKIEKDELTRIMEADNVYGMMGYDKSKGTHTVILIGVDSSDKPTLLNPPSETWPKLKNISEINDVIGTYLTP